jgi:hypothetical protein
VEHEVVTEHHTFWSKGDGKRTRREQRTEQNYKWVEKLSEKIREKHKCKK